VTAAASPFDQCLPGDLASDKPLRPASRNPAQTRQLNGEETKRQFDNFRSGGEKVVLNER
jgi:hypothetical protein